jgi:sterol desaturase/sphingolipid hydroxylase (fatty acid hydroxylase superfamily)
MLPARFVRLAFLPAMALLAALGIWLASSDRPEVVLLLVGAAAIATSFAAEQIAPYRPEWNRSFGDRGRDIAHAVVNETLGFASLALLPLLDGRLTIVDLWPSSWPFGLQVLFAVVVADLGITVTHRISHRVGCLWQLHAVHHSVTRFYGFNGLIKHPLHQAVELAAGVTPLVLIGLPANVASVLALCVVIQLLLQHSNVDYAVGPAGRWLALNQAHRFHHVNTPGEGDVNFGLFLTVWDRWILRTYRWAPDRSFSSDDLGISGRPDYPIGYLDQLREPFRPR